MVAFSPFLVTRDRRAHDFSFSLLASVRCLLVHTGSKLHTYWEPTYNSKRSHKLLLLESAVVSHTAAMREI